MAVTGYIVLTIEFAQEEGQWTALCRELGTAACGDTIEEAQEAIRALVDLHLNTLESLGECQAFLKRHRVPFFRRRPGTQHRDVPIGNNRLVQCMTERVPAFA